MLHLLGEVQPSAVSAMAYTGIGEPLKLEATYDVEEHSTVFVKFREDLAVTFETAWASNITSCQETIILGAKGGLRLDPFTYYAEEDDRGIATCVELPREPMKEWKGLIQDFVSACLENRKPRTPGEDGMKTMQIIDMAYQSSKLNREVRLEEL